ncbi:hypothetical protein [Saccharopolyspora sp. NPDC002376]
MKHLTQAALTAAALAVMALVGANTPAHAEGACPPGTGLFIDDGARIHRSNDLNSPVDGLYHTTHKIQVHEFLGGTPSIPDWIRITDTTTNVTGWLHSSVAACIALTSP